MNNRPGSDSPEYNIHTANRQYNLYLLKKYRDSSETKRIFNPEAWEAAALALFSNTHKHPSLEMQLNEPTEVKLPIIEHVTDEEKIQTVQANSVVIGSDKGPTGNARTLYFEFWPNEISTSRTAETNPDALIEVSFDSITHADHPEIVSKEEGYLLKPNFQVWTPAASEYPDEPQKTEALPKETLELLGTLVKNYSDSVNERLEASSKNFRELGENVFRIIEQQDPSQEDNPN